MIKDKTTREFVEVYNAEGTIEKLRVSDLDQEKLKEVRFYAFDVDGHVWETEGNRWLYIGDKNEQSK